MMKKLLSNSPKCLVLSLVLGLPMQSPARAFMGRLPVQLAKWLILDFWIFFHDMLIITAAHKEIPKRQKNVSSKRVMIYL